MGGLSVIDKDVLYPLSIGVLLGLVFLALTAKAQRLERERPAHVTTHWTVHELRGGYQESQVDVIDTAGVCLYVVRSKAFTRPTSPAIAAVPKSQLPPGTGCQ
jgi:hypothetical protein